MLSRRRLVNYKKYSKIIFFSRERTPDESAPKILYLPTYICQLVDNLFSTMFIVEKNSNSFSSYLPSFIVCRNKKLPYTQNMFDDTFFFFFMR